MRRAAGGKQPRNGPYGRQVEEDEEEDGAADEEQSSDDDLDEEDDRALLEAVLQQVRELKRAVKKGNRSTGKHELKRIVNPGTCGLPGCPVTNVHVACMTCRVRLCRDTHCWNTHINKGVGNAVGLKFDLMPAEDQGERKSIPGSYRAERGIRGHLKSDPTASMGISHTLVLI